MKLLKVLCVLALALCVTASVYAETQSVKVSGDLTMRGIMRNQYQYTNGDTNILGGTTLGDNGMSRHQSWIMSTTEVQIDADLTDNVSTCVRLLNQRDWNTSMKDTGVGTGLLGHYGGQYDDISSDWEVDVDLAYVTLKNFVYSPLTVTIGRQDLWFGKGFVVGLNQQVPGLRQSMSGNIMPSIAAPEYTAMNSFDAVKVVLDYDPWTITGIYSKIFENANNNEDDCNLWGVNVGYKFDMYKAEAEAYWFWKNDAGVYNASPGVSGLDARNNVHTIGGRGSFDPIDVITIALEGAYQFGNYWGVQDQANARGRAAYALDASLECRYLTDKFAWKPKVGAEFVLYSGNQSETDPVNATGTWKGWDPMYRGKFDSAIREFVGKFYTTSDYPAQDQYYATRDASYQNQAQVIFSGSIQPVESLTLKGNVNLFWTLQDLARRDNNETVSKSYIGTEFDLQATWDYTEDVSFNILGGWFVPGDIYYSSDKTATDLVGTVKVSF